MPPKRWGVIPRAPTGHAADLTQYILREIESNNCLGLEAAEIAGMARELLGSKTRAEVYEWSNTLMMGEAFAAEVIKRRADYGPPFEGEAAPSVGGAGAAGPPVGAAINVSSSLAGSGRPAAHAKVPKRGKRVISLNKMKADGAGDGAGGALKPRRFECGCFGTVHNVRVNCANCGRIVCEQEDDAACYYCGMDPARCIAEEIAVQDGKLSMAAQQQSDADYQTAVRRRDQLLEYAQNRARRTAVIDDQSATLFSPQSAWMTPQERQQVQKDVLTEHRRQRVEAMHKHKGAYEVHIDFVNQNVALGALERDCGDAQAEAETDSGAACADEEEERSDAGVVEESDGVDAGVAPLPTLLKKIWYSPDGSRVEEGKSGSHTDSSAPDLLPTRSARPPLEEVSRRVQQTYFEDDMAMFMEEVIENTRAELIFDPQRFEQLDPDTNEVEAAGASAGNAGERLLQSPPIVFPSAELASRFAPTSNMLMTDDGICLSMHQPWASLLVAGIKTHEGRVWSTTYRGRLWIHAASAQPVNVAEVEEHYSQFMSPVQSFPKYYPTRALLGYVYLSDCLDKEAYEDTFTGAQRQEGSPFSFICVEPKALSFPLPMNGDHKLFRLEKKVHVAALKQLQEIAT